MLSNTCKYSIRALIYLELYASEKNKIGLKKVSEELDIPQPFLGKIMQVLVKKEILDSVKGPHGGFCLKKAAFDISLMELIELFDGRSIWDNCAIRNSACSKGEPCSLHHKLAPIRKQMRSLYASESIGDLVSEFREGRENIRI